MQKQYVKCTCLLRYAPSIALRLVKHVVALAIFVWGRWKQKKESLEYGAGKHHLSASTLYETSIPVIERQ